ncbi:hypothetical protein KDL29_11535 [bacterium]|nr:hypothetical protein [bacterium]
MPRPFASWNAEIMRSEFMRCLWQGRGWLIAGVLLQSAVALYFIFISPFGLGREFADLVFCAHTLATISAVLTLLWLMSSWLGPPQRRDEGIDSLPIPPVQRQLMDWFPLIVVPLLLALSAVVVWGCLQPYFGVPFGSGSQLGEDWIVTDGPEGWLTVANPWVPRVLATALSILSAGLLPLAIGLLLERSLQSRLLRAVAILLCCSGAVYVMMVWGRGFVQSCYRQTRGHHPLPYIAIGVILLLLPLLLGLLSRGWRSRVALVLALLLMTTGLLPFLQDSLTLPGLSAELRNTLGDGRFAIAWYFGHTDFILDIGWLMTSWKSNLLLGTPVEPHRVPIWVGAALLPFLYVIWLPGGYLLGMSISGQRADID